MAEDDQAQAAPSQDAPPQDEPPVLFLHNVERRYRQGEATLEILNGAELAVWPGQSVALVGPSGAGKSTLLHVAGAAEAKNRAIEILVYLGLKERLAHRPAELSGGEQQRVAIARAVANAPRLLLADEPTGNLDAHTADHVFTALTQLVRASGLATLVATHNMAIASRMDRRVTIREGKVVELE